MVKGTQVSLGGQDYEVPSLTFDQVDEFEAKGTLDKIPSNGVTYLAVKDSRVALLDVAHAALSRNYPEMKREDLRKLIDLEAVEPLVDAVMSATGLKRRLASTGEAVSP
jgi:hypothetical protein